MWTLLLLPALAGTVTLDLGVHVDAGTVADVATDGAAGQCTVAPAALVCPASGPVSFRWGPESPEWALSGDVVLQPGERGTAWVLAPDAARADELARLDRATVTAADVDRLFHRAGTDVPQAPSRAMLDALVGLHDHPDRLVRRRVVDALLRWSWRSSLGPLPPTAPVPIAPGVLAALSRDEDPGVRRRVAVLIRHLRPCHLSGEAEEALARLWVDKHEGVRAAAIRTSGRAHLANATTVEEAWDRAMLGVRQPGPPGRASAATLAYLATVREPHDVLDAPAAVEETLTHHPDQAWRVWSRWRDEVPYRGDWALLLLRDTWNLNPALVKHWARTEPAALAATLRRWEPSPPHSRRFEVVARLLGEVEDPELRDALGLPVER